MIKNRYSIEEAGIMLDSETNNGGVELLMNAAAAGALKVYLPGNNAQFPVDQILDHRNYLEAYGDDLNVWLKTSAPRIKFEFPAPASEPVTPTILIQKPVQRIVAQDAAILAEIKFLHLDPLNLPEHVNGKSGARARIRKSMEERNLTEYKDIFMSTGVYETAWQRLLDDIKDRRA